MASFQLLLFFKTTILQRLRYCEMKHVWRECGIWATKSINEPLSRKIDDRTIQKGAVLGFTMFVEFR